MSAKKKTVVKFKKHKPAVSKAIETLMNDGWIVHDTCEIMIPDPKRKVRKALKKFDVASRKGK